MSAKRAVNLSIDGDLLDEAKRYGINLSRFADNALREALQEERQRRWREEHAAGLQAWNEWVEENGIPFSDLRPW
jgi:antitoxin CcdA